MMIKNFLSKDFMRDLERVTRKEIEEITEEDLNRIERIKLQFKNYDGTDKDYQLADLTNLKNLKVLTFSKFHFTQEDIFLLNSLEKLYFIDFDFCQFDLEHFNFNASIEYLNFNVCQTLKFTMLENTKAKSIKIVGSELEKLEVDIADLNHAENLEELSINHFSIKNLKELTSIAPKIYSLNMDGSNVTDDTDLNIIGVKVSHEEMLLRANA